MGIVMGRCLDSRTNRRRPIISQPYDQVHLTHVTYDSATCEFGGVPKEWQEYLDDLRTGNFIAKDTLPPVLPPLQFSASPAPRAQSAPPQHPLIRPLATSNISNRPPLPTVRPVATRFSTQPAIIVNSIPPPNYLTSLERDSKPSSCRDFDFPAFHARLHMLDPFDHGSDTPLAEMDWSRYLFKNDDAYAGDGRFGTVYKGTWKLPEGLEPPPDVAIKVIRHLSVEDTVNENMTILPVYVRREVSVWKDLRHPNILPFIGIAKGHGTVPSLVSLWMENGTVKDFLRLNPFVNRPKIILGVANGLDYLHSHKPRITHGDLKAVNILVDAKGNPRLGDFGLSRIFEDQSLWITSATSAPGTIRWMAPELLTGEQPFITPESDVYAFGMTTWEIVANRSPFSRYKMDAAVLAAVTLRNERPERLSSKKMPDSVWTVMTKCWATRAVERPTMQSVVQMLETL